MENIILTDFNKERWSGIDMNSVYNALNDLIEKTNTIGVLYGEKQPPSDLDISLSKISHSISNIRLENKIIYGDIYFLPSFENTYENKEDIEFSIRSVGTTNNNSIHIEKIFTWDLLNE